MRKEPQAPVHATEAASFDQDQFYREIIDSAIDTAVICTDRRGRITTWSAGAEHMTGWNSAEMLGRLLDTIYTRDDQAAGRPAMEMRAADQSGRARDMRWHLRKDGGLFYAHGSITPLKGSLKGYVKSFRDATVQHQTETALKEAKERMEFTLTSAQIVGTWDWDILNDRFNADVRFARIHLLDEALAVAGVSRVELRVKARAARQPRTIVAIEYSRTTAVPCLEQVSIPAIP